MVNLQWTFDIWRKRSYHNISSSAVRTLLSRYSLSVTTPLFFPPQWLLVSQTLGVYPVINIPYGSRQWVRMKFFAYPLHHLPLQSGIGSVETSLCSLMIFLFHFSDHLLHWTFSFFFFFLRNQSCLLNAFRIHRHSWFGRSIHCSGPECCGFES